MWGGSWNGPGRWEGGGPRNREIVKGNTKWNMGIGIWKLEYGNRNMGIGIWELECGDWKYKMKYKKCNGLSAI
jgi:hypothetical protein